MQGFRSWGELSLAFIYLFFASTELTSLIISKVELDLVFIAILVQQLPSHFKGFQDAF